MKTKRPNELFEVLEELHRQYPEWRFGQLVANVAGWTDQDVWDVEDDALLEAARSHLKKAKRRTQEVCLGAGPTKAVEPDPVGRPNSQR